MHLPAFLTAVRPFASPAAGMVGESAVGGGPPAGVVPQWPAGSSIALAVYLGAIQGLDAVAAPFQVPWWLLAIGYGLAEVLVVHLQFRRDTHSFSLSEIPLVVGLFFLRPSELLLALVVGRAVALALHRRQPLIKLAFNLANLACVTSAAVLVFRSIVAARDPLGPAGWLGAMAAAIGADILSLLLISFVVWLAVGRPPEVAKLIGSGTVASFFNTCVALVTVTVLWIKPEAIWLPLVLAGMMVGAYRIYGSVRQKHESLEVLYEVDAAAAPDPRRRGRHRDAAPTGAGDVPIRPRGGSLPRHRRGAGVPGRPRSGGGPADGGAT